MPGSPHPYPSSSSTGGGVASSRRLAALRRRLPGTRGAALLAAAIAALAGSAPASAAPGDPATPTVIFAEGFENASPTLPVRLADYVGLSPTAMTYSAHANWLDAAQCNGIIVSGGTSNDPACGYNSQLRSLADALGQVNGVTPPTANHALAAYTNGNPGADNVQLETQSTVPLAGSGRFLAFSVDSATINCFATAPLYVFQLLNPDGAEPVDQVIPTGPAINGCAAPFQAVGGARIKRNFSARGIFFSGARVGVRLRNANGSGGGNDAAVDNLQILDATPRLDKEFVEGDLLAGATGRLRLTVTNTSDLAEKDGWSFVDTLASGLKVAADPDLDVQCRDATGEPTSASGVAVDAPAGGGAIEVGGLLKQGDASCFVELAVVADAAGTYANGPDQITSHRGIDLPQGPAEIRFHGPPTVAISGPGPDAPIVTGTSVPGRYGCAATAAIESCTATVTLPDGSSVPLKDGDPVPTATPGTYTITAKVRDALGQERTVTRTYVVQAPPPTVPEDPAPKGALTLSKRVLTPTLRPGRSTRVRLRVTNRTNRTLTGVVVCERVPAGMRFVSATPKAKLVGGRRCWTIGTLKPGQAVTLGYRARALNRPGRVRTRATGRAAGVRDAQASAPIRILRAPVRGGGVTG